VKNTTQFPVGLNSLLLLRERGEQVSLLEDSIRTTVDIRDMFLLNDRKVRVFPLTATAIGGNVYAGAIGQVPAGELWYVWHYTINAPLAAAETLNVAAAIEFPDLGFQVLGRENVVNGSIAAASQVTTCAYRPFWAPPGSVFGFHVLTETGAPQVGGRCVYTPLKI